MHQHRLAIVCACLLLAACGGDNAEGGRAQPGAESLPKPDAASGSVTGMPNPGRPSAQPSAITEMPGIDTDGGTDDATAVDPAVPMEPAPVEQDDAGAAVSVLRDYYAAINARDYDLAWSQWSDGGRASGQSLQQFVAGFADTAGVSVSFGESGVVEGAAGSRYIEIPATLEATQADGSVRHYTGGFTLRLSVVDGASEAQRSWHIAASTLREVRP